MKVVTNSDAAAVVGALAAASLADYLIPGGFSGGRKDALPPGVGGGEGGGGGGIIEDIKTIGVWELLRRGLSTTWKYSKPAVGAIGSLIRKLGPTGVVAGVVLTPEQGRGYHEERLRKINEQLVQHGYEPISYGFYSQNDLASMSLDEAIGAAALGSIPPLTEEQIRKLDAGERLNIKENLLPSVQDRNIYLTPLPDLKENLEGINIGNPPVPPKGLQVPGSSQLIPYDELGNPILPRELNINIDSSPEFDATVRERRINQEGGDVSVNQNAAGSYGMF